MSAKFIVLLSWLFIGSGLIGSCIVWQRVMTRYIVFIRACAPVSLGVLFVFVTLVLFSLNKYGEGLAEFAIGLSIIGYGLLQTGSPGGVGQRGMKIGVGLVGFMISVEVATLHGLVFGFLW